MPGASTSFVGPLGSTIYRLRADAATVAALAGLDWTGRFRRVCLDPVRGVVVLMAPSHLHERLTGFDDIVDGAASELDLASIACAVKGSPPAPAWSRAAPSMSASAPMRISPPWPRAREQRTPSSKRTARTSSWKSRLPTPTRARSRATATWACGSAGGSTASAGTRRSGQTSWPSAAERLRASAGGIRPPAGPHPSDAGQAVEGFRRGADSRERIEAVARIVRRRRRISRTDETAGRGGLSR